MEYKLVLYLVLAVLLGTTCVNQTRPSNSTEGKGDEEEFTLISSVYGSRFNGKPFDSPPQVIVDYFLEKGFTQVPINVKFYHLAGLHDSKAGQVEVSNTFKCDGFYAFVKKTELGVGLLVVGIPCPENPYATTCSNYFFSKQKFEMTTEKCDKGNSATYERYFHDEWIGGKQFGIQKDVSTIELCFDGKYVSQAEVHIW